MMSGKGLNRNMKLQGMQYRRKNQGFTLIEILIAVAVMGSALIVMGYLHSQALRSNMHAKRMTDCTYLAQARMETLHALPWTASSTPTDLVDSITATTGAWDFLEHPSSGIQPPARSAGNNATTNYAYGPRVYYVTWDVEEMDTNATWMKMIVRCQYLDEAFNQWRGTTISSFRFRDS